MFSTKETDLFPLQFSWLKLNRSMWINNYFRISAPLSLIRGYCFFTNYVAVLIFSFELQKYGMKKKKSPWPSVVFVYSKRRAGDLQCVYVLF